MAEEHLDLKYTAWKLIGSEKASKKMIGLEQLCQHPGKHAVDWLQIFTFLNLHISFTIDQKPLGVYIWGLFREFYRKV